MARYTPSTVRSVHQINAEFEKIKNSIDTMVDREGTAPNQMEAELDMNSNRILNLPDPINQNEAVTKKYIDDLLVAEGAQAVTPIELERIVADGVNFVFTVPNVNDSPARSYLVFLDGVRQKPDTDYMVAGTALSFNDTPEAGMFIDITYYEPQVANRITNNVKYYSNLQEAIADTSLTVGESVVTTGYYTDNDGGGGTYNVVPKNTGTDDGGSYINALNGSVQLELIRKGSVRPEQYGAKGNGVYDDTTHIVNFLSNEDLQDWTADRTYILNSDTAGDNSAFKIKDKSKLRGNGCTVDLQGTANNGFYLEGALSDVLIEGFNFVQTTASTIGVAISVHGFVTNCTIRYNTADGLDQYFLGMGDTGSGYDNLTIHDNKVTNTNTQADNEFSLCYELFPTLQSKTLHFFNNYGEQVGNGGVFKIHTCEDSHIYNNTFIRTSNTGASGSQCVMLGGRVTNPVQNVYFHNNFIKDANTGFGALFVGNTSENIFIADNNIEGAGDIWVGNGISTCRISGNRVSGGIYSISTATNDIDDLVICDNDLGFINLHNPPSGNPPSSVSGLNVKDNIIRGQFRLSVQTSIDTASVSNNEFINLNSTILMYADNIEFTGNKVTVSDDWSAGSQPIVANSANYLQMGNTFYLKGSAAQSVWLNGTTDAQVIDNVVKDTQTRVALDNGTATQIFNNKQRISGTWSVV